jgi:hypothetical protein
VKRLGIILEVISFIGYIFTGYIAWSIEPNPLARMISYHEEAYLWKHIYGS